jgi:hypothetical protein
MYGSKKALVTRVIRADQIRVGMTLAADNDPDLELDVKRGGERVAAIDTRTEGRQRLIYIRAAGQHGVWPLSPGDQVRVHA